MNLISVIVPVYNVEKYLDRCVSSIVNQTYGNLEIILVDDGSPDNCPAMCDAWAKKDSRIKVIHKQNGGLSDARNAGMAIVAGEYISFVDSDDWIHPEYIHFLHQACVEHNSLIAACDVQLAYESEQYGFSANSYSSHPCSTAQAMESLITGRQFRAVAWNKLYHRSTLKGEFFPVGKYHEDEFFTYRILHKAPMLSYVDIPLYFYFQRSGSIMNSVSVKHLDSLEAGLARLDFLKQHYPQFYLRDKVVFCISCVNHYCGASAIDASVQSDFKKRILAFRASVHFSVSELLRCSVKNMIYILGSRISMECFCNLLGNRRNLIS